MEEYIKKFLNKFFEKFLGKSVEQFLEESLKKSFKSIPRDPMEESLHKLLALFIEKFLKKPHNIFLVKSPEKLLEESLDESLEAQKGISVNLYISVGATEEMLPNETHSLENSWGRNSEVNLQKPSF